MDALEQLDALVKRCQRGDQEAFETLFSQYQPRLKFYVRWLTTPRHDQYDFGASHAYNYGR